jgi:glycosyltransferase involved in cell wall biosynthesis
VVGVNGGAMPERVLPGMGLLGPIADVRAMAANIQTVLASDHRAMGEHGRAFVAGEYSWPHSMEKLFGTIIPQALARAATRQLPRGAPTGSLVEA